MTAAAAASMIVMAFAAEAAAQTPLTPEQRSEVIDSVSSRWNDWQTVSISGKFKMAGLPLSPSMKIYMERDSSVLISLRAPLMGEVGRAEIVGDTILVVNKMNKTYVEEPIEKTLAYYPGGISDIQDLLLGRIVVPGYGTLSPELADMMEIYASGEGTAAVVPCEAAMLPGFNYGYIVDADWLTDTLMVVPLEKPGVVVTLAYEYFAKGYDIEFAYESEKKNYRAVLELDEPQWDGKGFDRIKLASKYKKLPFDKFIKSF